MALRIHEVHPSIVHFPLTLMPASLMLDAAGRMTGSAALMNTARTLMPAATVSGVVAGLAGLVAQQTVRAEGRAHDTLVTHRNLNLGLLLITAGLTAVRLTRRRPGWGYLLAGLGGFAAMNYTAYLGGKLPYAHGVGVESASGVRSNSVEIRRGSYARAARLALRYIGQGVTQLIRELRRGEVAPLLRRPSAAIESEAELHSYGV